MKRIAARKERRATQRAAKGGGGAKMRDRGRKVWILTLEIQLNIRSEMPCIKLSIVLRTR